jgi:hypothetical protein
MKISKVQPKSKITAKTTKKISNPRVLKWWTEGDEAKAASQMLTTAAFLKETQSYRYRQTAIYARLYGNMSLFNYVGVNISKMDQQKGLPSDRPTRNVIQSSVDTLVSRLSQSRPAPVFLTDNGDYKERNLAKKLNNFILGEFYQTKAYEKAEQVLRDGMVTGTGCLHVYETNDAKVGLERVLLTELLIDTNEAMYGEPRQLYRMKLIDREVLKDAFPKAKKLLESAVAAYPDDSSDSSTTVSDMVMVVEGWRLPSGPGANDGRHMIACSSGSLVDEAYAKEKFPFVFFHYAPRLLGFWSQGIAERLMGTQLDINSLLYQISKAIKLVGVPRVFQESGSRVTKASHNNEIGVIVEYTGIKPSYEVAPCVPQELYAQLDRMVEYAFQQEGVSMMQASSTKPAGLNSGEAIRSYDDISTDRFASTARHYDNLFIDLAYQIVDLAKDIAERDGKYQTVFPDKKNGTRTIDFPDLALLEDPFVIQCFSMSSLPKDPAGRKQTVTDMVQSGMISLKEGRRLLDYPDLDQIETLANASEERIYMILDEIVDEGKYTPPDPFMDLVLAKDTVVQYYNLYAQRKLEPERCEMLRTFFNQVNDLVTAAQPPAPQAAPQAQAVPQAPPVSDMLPTMPQGGPQAFAEGGEVQPEVDDQTAIAWSHMNPTHPHAAIIKAIHGIR